MYVYNNILQPLIVKPSTKTGMYMYQLVCAPVSTHCTALALGYLPHLALHVQSTGHSTPFSTPTSVRTCTCTCVIHTCTNSSSMYMHSCTVLPLSLPLPLTTKHDIYMYNTVIHGSLFFSLRRLNHGTTMNCVLAYLIGDIISEAVACYPIVFALSFE